jgi:hypothetical protein
LLLVIPADPTNPILTAASLLNVHHVVAIVTMHLIFENSGVCKEQNCVVIGEYEQVFQTDYSKIRLFNDIN